MYAKSLMLCFGMLAATQPAEAQLSKLLREGIEYAGKAAAKTAGKGAARTTTTATSRLVREVAEEGAESAAKAASKLGREAVEVGAKTPLKAAVKTAGRTTAESTARVAGKTAVQEGASVSADALTKQFGPAGAKAAAALSEESAARLVAVSDELAASGQASQWLSLIADSGNVAVDWLWERRGSIAVGTTATAVLLAPKEFVQASQEFASDSVNAAGKYVFEPLISESAEHVAEPLAKNASVMATGGGVPWMWLIGWTVALAVLWYQLRRLWPRRG